MLNSEKKLAQKNIVLKKVRKFAPFLRRNKLFNKLKVKVK